MVQMKITTSLLIAAAVIAPVVANGFEAQDSLVTREDNEFEARDFDLELEEREFDDELFEREPRGGRFVKQAFKFGRKAASAYSPPQSPSEAREFDDDLFERARGGGRGYSRKAGGGGGGRRMMRTGGGGRGFKKGLGRAAAAVASPPESPSEAREFDDDILEREFDEELYERGRGGGMGRGMGRMRSSSGGRRMMRAGGKGFKKALSRGASAGSPPPESPSEAREFDEDLYERAPKGGSGGGGHGSGGHSSGSHGSGGSGGGGHRREFTEELDERSSASSGGSHSSGGHGSGGGHGASGGHGSSGGHGHGSGGSHGPSGGHGRRELTEELAEREIEGDELFGRDVDFELFEREPEPFLFFNRIKKWWNNRKAKKAAATEDAAPETRSFDEMELLEREYYDELD